ncbi:MAG: Flp pilus assembly protein CpaB [Isosphaeraceae bacterium]|nr:Flp pilus assembly protein CpaB [Isosphaeraceae bacterium]
MNGKSLTLLLLAVVSGLGAMYGTSKLLASKNRDKRVSVEMQDVIVAARDLKVEEMLKPDLVKVVQMTKSDVPAGAFSSFKDVEDRWVMIKTLSDEPILDKKLAPKGTPAGIVPRIPPGMRAFTLEVNESTGVSGFVLPDHRVDVVQSRSLPNGETEAETILEDVLVLASGTVFNRPEERTVQSRGVTLAVTPEQAEVIVAARTKGLLSLALRGLNDRAKQDRSAKAAKKAAETPVAVKPVEPPAAPPPPPPPPPPVVAPTEDTQHVIHLYKGIDQHRQVRLNSPHDDDDEQMVGFGKEKIE